MEHQIVCKKIRVPPPKIGDEERNSAIRELFPARPLQTKVMPAPEIIVPISREEILAAAKLLRLGKAPFPDARCNPDECS